MPSDFGMRGQAAQRLAKGKKGMPPEEDDLGLPPEDGADSPAPDGSGGTPDLAALLGAAGGGAGGPPPAPGEQMAPMPDDEAAEGEGRPQDLDTALGGVENCLEGLPPEAAEEIRVHLNAIREIASKTGAPAAPDQKQQPPGGNDAGMDALPATAPAADKEIAG